jgi:polyphenol oxidase
MQKIFKKNVPAFQFHLLQKFDDEFNHAVFSKKGGVSVGPFDSLNVSFEVEDSMKNVQRNRRLIMDSFGLPMEMLFSARQTHGKNVRVIDASIRTNAKGKTEFEDTDALVTNLAEVFLLIKVADCQGILLFDPIKKVIAVVHAGWRGLVQDISGATIEVMQREFGVQPQHILAGISPSLGPCCAFFSNPEKELPSSFKPYINKAKSVDLWQYSLDQLQAHGLSSEHIELARVCSSCGGGGKFFSFRRDRGVTGRFGVGAHLF